MASDNPYQAPGAELRDPVTAGPAGGSLEDGVSGNYDFEIMEVIREGWQRQNGMKGTTWLALLLYVAVMVALGFVQAMVLAAAGTDPNSAGVLALATQLVVTVVSWPMYAGLMMIGINRSVDLPLRATMVFGYFGSIVAIAIAMILVSIFTVIGFLLLIVPGIYLSIAYSMTLPLIVEKRLGVWEAMESSRRAVSKHWFKYFFTMLLMSLIAAVSAIPLFLGLIWTIPMMFAVIGVLYRVTFGVEEAREAPVMQARMNPALA